jgi:hypothetical protein
VSDNNVIQFAQPGAFSDSLTEILRSGARALLTQAIEAEVADFLAKHADLKIATGQQRVVRHGHRPERAIRRSFAGNVWATAPQFCGPKNYGDGSHGGSDSQCSVHVFD